MKRTCWFSWVLVLWGIGFVQPARVDAQSVLLDANLKEGYQGLDGLVDIQVGQRIGLEVYGKEIEGVSGFSVQVSFNAAQLQFDGFTSGVTIPGFTGLSRTAASGSVEIGGASVAGASKAAQGRLGIVYFKVLDAVAGGSAVSLGSGNIVKGTATTSITPQAQVVVGLSVTGPVLIDGDASPGLQAARRVVDVKAGDAIAIEVYGRGIIGASGFSAILQYDKAQLSFEGFDASEIIPGFTGLRIAASGTIEIGGASVTGKSGSTEGRLGVMRFKVLAGFTGKTTIELVGGRLTLGSEITNYTSDLIISIAGLAGGSLVKTPDFNGNGKVDFPDFLIFAAAFGKRLGDVGYLASIDLNDNGSIDFPDFLVFAQQFGKSVGN